MLFYIVVVILMWLCDEVSGVCLHCHRDRKSMSIFEYLFLIIYIAAQILAITVD